MSTSSTKLTPEVLKFRDCGAICEQIEDYIRKRVEASQRTGVVIGLSGGLDSVVVTYLCARSIGARKVLALYMPDRESKVQHKEDAMRVADDLGVEFKIGDLTPILDAFGIYQLLPFRYFPGRKTQGMVVRLSRFFMQKFAGRDLIVDRTAALKNRLLARGVAYSDLKHRLRAIMLYYYAELENRLVVGAGTKTEYFAGAFCQWGCDHLADIMPIRNMYSTQERQLAKYLGIPEKVIQKPPDPDIMPGVDDKEKLYGSYETIDLISYGLENKVPFEELYNQFGRERVNRVMVLTDSSKHMRESPYIPDITVLN